MYTKEEGLVYVLPVATNGLAEEQRKVEGLVAMQELKIANLREANTVLSKRLDEAIELDRGLSKQVSTLMSLVDRAEKIIDKLAKDNQDLRVLLAQAEQKGGIAKDAAIGIAAAPTWPLMNLTVDTSPPPERDEGSTTALAFRDQVGFLQKLKAAGLVLSK